LGLESQKKKCHQRKMSPRRSHMPLQVGATWELLLLASFATCPPLIGEYLKLGLQANFAIGHSPNGEDPLHL